MSNNFSEYNRQLITNVESFTHTPAVTLLARTQSVLPPDEFDEDQWQWLNAATTIAGESARTCYSKDLITPLDYAQGTAKHRQTTDNIVASTREAGHLSTRQHVYYLFALEGVSRNIIYSVLHSYPHHNSDQVSQRYTPMSEEGLVLPILRNTESNAKLHLAAKELVIGYHHLTDILIPVAREFYLQRFPARRGTNWQKKVDQESTKKAQEVGRYLLPLAMGANLYHSVSALTLMRYYKLSEAYSFQPEAKLLIKTMINQVATVDPSILSEIDTPLSYQDPVFNSINPYESADIADHFLNGSFVRLDLDNANFVRKLADAVRLTLGIKISDAEAIDIILNPEKNKLLASTHGEMTMDQLSQALNQVYLSATVSLSHSADSQLQRHRAFNHTQPLILPIPRLESDIVIPALLHHYPEALNYYLNMQSKNIDVMKELFQSGISLDQLSYLQTNGTRIRKRISGPLGAFYHWIKIRTCLTAQEEIYGLAVGIARQLPKIDPQISIYFDKPAPCGVRQKAGLTPLCPEGDRYCGVPIWKKSIADYPNRDI